MRFDASGATWGTSQEEIRASYPCEAYVDPPFERFFRAVSVGADAATLFRWVCQLTVAPYSYDLLDNHGKRSPRQLTPGADDLAVGQRFDGVFSIVEYVAGEHITGISTPGGERLFGRMSLTCSVRPSPTGSRLVVCIAVPADGLWPRARRRVLAYGDLVMMRKQLLTLKALAEAAT